MSVNLRSIALLPGTGQVPRCGCDRSVNSRSRCSIARNTFGDWRTPTAFRSACASATGRVREADGSRARLWNGSGSGSMIAINIPTPPRDRRRAGSGRNQPTISVEFRFGPISDIQLTLTLSPVSVKPAAGQYRKFLTSWNISIFQSSYFPSPTPLSST